MASFAYEQVKLKIGESTTVKLKGLSSAGYEWNYEIDDNEDCIEITKDYKMPGNVSQSNMGASAEEIFTITAQKKGIVDIHFTQRRGWEKDVDPVNEKKIEIIVED